MLRLCQCRVSKFFFIQWHVLQHFFCCYSLGSAILAHLSAPGFQRLMLLFQFKKDFFLCRSFLFFLSPVVCGIGICTMGRQPFFPDKRGVHAANFEFKVRSTCHFFEWFLMIRVKILLRFFRACIIYEMNSVIFSKPGAKCEP